MIRIALLLSMSGLAIGCGGRSDSHESAGAGGSGAAGPASGAAAGSGGNSGFGGRAGMGNGGAGAPVSTCSDYTAPPLGFKSCRSNGDCDRSQQCLAPGQSIEGCGVCLNPDRECDKSSDCQAGFICREYAQPCTCPSDALASRCQRACVSSDCAAGTRCSDASGLCEPIPCDDGYACPAGETCGADAGTPDEHGCVAISCGDGFECPDNTRCTPNASEHGCVAVPCALDTDCDCGACVNGSCASGPGQCVTTPV